MDKDIVFIVSAGRTGTKFFGELLSKMIVECHSVHEPDVIHGVNSELIGKIKTFGIYHMLIGRILGQTGIRPLTLKYLSNQISLNELGEKILNQRKNYYESTKKRLIVESYNKWYGILPGIPMAFPEHYKILAIIRDPRDWVTSSMNFQTPFGSRDHVHRLGFQRLNPSIVNDKKYILEWNDMSRFKKLCWTWNTVYEIILNFAKSDQNTALFRYEDLFKSRDRGSHFKKLLEFTTHFNNRDHDYKFAENDLNHIVNSTTEKSFPSWVNWDSDQARTLERFCQPLMAEFGYGKEDAWLRKID